MLSLSARFYFGRLWVAFQVGTLSFLAACSVDLKFNLAGQSSDSGGSPVITNNNPVASDVLAQLEEDGSALVTLVASDEDGDPLTFAVLSGPTYGQLTGSGSSRTYTPNPSYSGTDTFTYRVHDGQAYSDPKTVTLQVAAYCSGARLSNSPFAAGAGTALDPYRICTESQFVAIATQMTSHFELWADITMTTPLDAPLGSSKECIYDPDINDYAWVINNVGFAGTLDGRFRAVRNLFVDQSPWTIIDCDMYGAGDAAFFAAMLPGSVLKNIKFENMRLSHGMLGSSFVSRIEGATVSKVMVDYVSLGSTEVGASFSQSVLLSSVIEQVHVKIGSYQVYCGGGGLVGSLGTGSILRDVYLEGNITIGDCSSFGGLVDWIDNTSRTERVIANLNLQTDGFGGDVRAGLFANASGAIDVIETFWNIDTSVIDSTYSGSSYGEGKTTAELQNPTTYTGWDSNVWQMTPGEYPKLQWLQ